MTDTSWESLCEFCDLGELGALGEPGKLGSWDCGHECHGPNPGRARCKGTGHVKGLVIGQGLGEEGWIDGAGIVGGRWL